MTNFVSYALAFILLIGVLVVVHELGHYLAARWCGVKLLRFSFGFGPVLFLRRFGKDGTEWSVAAFPLGGFVRMLDEREGDVDASERHRAFNTQSVGKRSLIVFAGPFANFVLAFVLLWFCAILGRDELKPVLGNPPENTPAAVAGIRNGDEVRSVDGVSVQTFEELRWTLAKKAVDQELVELETINAKGEIAIHRLALTAIGEHGWVGDGMQLLGIRFYQSSLPPLVRDVRPGSEGEKSGLRQGDRLLALDGTDLFGTQDFVDRIVAAPDRLLKLEVERDGQRLQLDVRPLAVVENGRTVGRIGVMLSSVSDGRELWVFVRHSPLAAAGRALVETWEKSLFSLRMMGRMLTGDVSWRNLSGPVTIADYAGQTARLGLEYYLNFMALVSLGLGVLNLLPVPVLDGGHLMYHMLEVVRRRPLSERAMELGQRIGLAMLVVLMAFAFFNDMNRLLTG